MRFAFVQEVKTTDHSPRVTGFSRDPITTIAVGREFSCSYYNIHLLYKVNSSYTYSRYKRHNNNELMTTRTVSTLYITLPPPNTILVTNYYTYTLSSSLHVPEEHA